MQFQIPVSAIRKIQHYDYQCRSKTFALDSYVITTYRKLNKFDSPELKQ